MIDAAMTTLAVIHFGIWMRSRAHAAHLWFALFALSTAAGGGFEFAMFRADSIAEFVWAQRWQQVPGTVMALSLIFYSRSRLAPGRNWLAISAVTLRLVALVATFTTGVDLQFMEIESISRVSLLGEPVTVVLAGKPNPWFLVAKISNLLLFAYLVDALIALWRVEGDESKRRAALIGGAMALIVAIIILKYNVGTPGIAGGPYAANPTALVLIAFMAFDLSSEVFRANQLYLRLQVTDRELLVSGQRMHIAAAAAKMGTWEWDVARDELTLSPEARSFYGFSTFERIGLARLFDPRNPGIVDATDSGLRESVLQEGGIDREYTVLLDDSGAERWIHSHGRIENVSGQPLRVRGVSVDVTERRLAQERFRRVVKSAPCGMVILQADGAIEIVNAKAEADFGYTRAELIGGPVEQLIPQGIAGLIAKTLGAVGSDSAQRVMTTGESMGRRKDGTTFALEIVLNNIRNSHGDEIIVMLTDVSAKKRHLEQMKQERAFLRQIIDIAPPLLFVKDRAGRFTLANQAAADIYGTTVEELIGKTDADFPSVQFGFTSAGFSDIDVLDQREQRVVPEEQVTDARGNVHWMQRIKRPILYSDGQTDRVLVSATNITARKQTELELSRQRNELEHLSRVTMLSELSGSIAHELNQPLAAILSNAQAASRFLAVNEPNLVEVREILVDIVSDDRRAGEIIKGLRLLLKKGQRREEPIDVNLVALGVLKLVNSDMLNAGIRVTTRLASDLPKVSSDQVQVQQILLNLLMNAIDAMAAKRLGDREIIVETAIGEGRFVSVCVSDCGHGIPEPDLERVFEAFFTTKAHGLGLGLAVCRRIVTSHGGKLWARNNAHGGATFCFVLPIETVVAA